ncbi:hypothetical protein EXS61_00880 [Candidatus Parcubacteria bacterium]|nr:hypothetical protein [Candidatus Parcubacteria bacterium]
MLKNINLKQATATSLLITLMLSFGYGLAEPAFLQAIEDQFTVKQTITAEITFATPANDVVMNGSIAGITGGTSYGTSTSVVTTNNNTGFTMTLAASSSPAMVGDAFAGTIADYTPATTGIPDFTFSVPAGAEFGFSVSASTTANLAQKFKDNGTNTCNTGSADTSAGSCWMGLSTVATSTIVTSAATSASGATSSIYFSTFLNSGGLTIEDTYTATMTQTAIIN